MDSRSHWEGIYRNKLPTQVSWYQPHARRSLALIRRVTPPLDGAIIDVGAGASTLVDDLLDAGYDDLTVLDLSGAALAVARARLGTRANTVQWVEVDVLDASLPKTGYSVWHDRAAFHFLTAPADRAGYVAQVRRAGRPGASFLVPTFAFDGPPRCSWPAVSRHAPD